MKEFIRSIIYSETTMVYFLSLTSFMLTVGFYCIKGMLIDPSYNATEKGTNEKRLYLKLSLCLVLFVILIFIGFLYVGELYV